VVSTGNHGALSISKRVRERGGRVAETSRSVTDLGGTSRTLIALKSVSFSSGNWTHSHRISGPDWCEQFSSVPPNEKYLNIGHDALFAPCWQRLIILVIHSCVYGLPTKLQWGYLATVPLGLGNAATDAVIAHTGKAVPCVGMPLTQLLYIFTVVWIYETACSPKKSNNNTNLKNYGSISSITDV
jgi:hypothetical protein